MHEEIKKLRTAKGLSQEYVASCLGMARGTYSGYERGRYKNSSPETLARIYEFLLETDGTTPSKKLIAGNTRMKLPERTDTLVEKLAYFRRWGGLSQGKIANLLGCDRSTVSHWEIGRSVPRPAQCEAIKELIGIRD
jgi:transcriptional regulator with XRE-family HTH domain